MHQTPFHNYRRSTRVPLEVGIEVIRGKERFMCEAQTIMVNLHGALISTTVALSADLHISIHVHLTDKRANARVVYIDPQNPFCCGVELDAPRNIWGVSLPPDDWRDRQREFESELDDLTTD